MERSEAVPTFFALLHGHCKVTGIVVQLTPSSWHCGECYIGPKGQGMR